MSVVTQAPARDIAPGFLTNLHIEALEHGFKDEVSCVIQDPNNCSRAATMRWRSRCPAHGVVASPCCSAHARLIEELIAEGCTLHHNEGSCDMLCEHLGITPL